MSERKNVLGSNVLHPVFICGGESGTGRHRDLTNRCPSVLHDWPPPLGYSDAEDEAMWRLRNHWKNPRCPDCETFGWVPGKITDAHVRRPAVLA